MAQVPSWQQGTSRMKPVAVNARRSVPADLVPAQLPSTESGGGGVFRSPVTPVFELRQVFRIIKICHTVACIRMALKYVQCCCSDLVSSSPAGDVGISQEGVGCSRRCNLSLHTHAPNT